MKKMECPCCGATLTVDDNSEFAVCEFCGSQVRIDDYRSTNVIVDEAMIKKTDNEKELRMKEMEMEQKNQEESRSNQKKMMYIGAAIFVAVLLFAFVRVALFEDFFTIGIVITFIPPIIFMSGIVYLITRRRRDYNMPAPAEGGVKYPMVALGDYQRRDYHEVESILKQVGFTNVLSVSAHDSFFGSGRVKDILVNGRFVSGFGNLVFPADVPILVRYH